jgi:hypothetical protein
VGVLVGLENFTGLFEVIDLLVGFRSRGMEESFGGLSEDDAFSPASWHCGDGRREGRRGRMTAERWGKGNSRGWLQTHPMRVCCSAIFHGVRTRKSTPCALSFSTRL